MNKFTEALKIIAEENKLDITELMQRVIAEKLMMDNLGRFGIGQNHPDYADFSEGLA